jgi:hypothetical protein
MDTSGFVLAALATSKGETWTPVQVQKFFFLLDRKLGGQIGGPFFDFRAYDYGPFDAAVCEQIEALEQQRLASVIRPEFGKKTYGLTATGQTRGENVLDGLAAPVRDYVVALGQWVRTRSFAELVSAIYQQFPEMKARSVFREFSAA